MAKERIKIKHRFITKLLISHILLASIPIIITAAVLIHTVHHAVEKVVNHRNLELARHLATSLEMTVANARLILEFNASNVFSTLKTRLAQDLFLNTLVSDFPIFRDFKYLNDSALVVLSTLPVERRDEYRQQAFIGQVLNGMVYQSEVYLYDDRLPVIQMAAPVRSYNQIDGLLLTEVNLKEMWELVEKGVIGKSGQAFVFDKNGRYLAHSEPKMVYLKQTFADETIYTDIKSDSSGWRIYMARNGTKMIASFVILRQLNWGVVIQQPVSEAFAVADKMKMQTLAFVAISIFLSSLIAFIYTRWIVTPVNQLVSGMEQFSAGDLKYRIPSLGMDEISKLAERFNEMAEKLIQFQEKVKKSERLETLNKMAAVFSHEIKNPLNAMVVNMRIIERELARTTPSVDKLQHYLGIVAAEIRRVDDLVNHFLTLGHPPKLKKSPVVISNILDELILSQQAEALQSGIRIHRRYAVSDLAIFVDEKQLRQVFLNILINAIQAMPGGGILTIGLELQRDREQRDWLVISFRDTGKGIPSEQLSRIFDFYYSTKQNGTGLGLSIAQQIVEEHGGRIEVESEVGIGSVFSVFLPREPNN
ncbi:MAG: ATP-binding protein [candidate division KSB1 bacterium]|nr:ATP-binding protein [candidate division KSB1 bacterium]MDZ7317604.1 ATP-binding protein [candidate division KSB1 bacterium]MDZ7340299.1 ATP-binding protein [candidate division KSB1 bacterium]